MSAEEAAFPPVLFKAAAGPVSLTCCVHQKAGANSNLKVELLVLDAAQSRGWSSPFSVSTVNAALQDEELTGPELAQVLAAVLPCQAAVTAVLQPGGQLRLEAWCHRTQRVPLLAPTSVQRQAGSDYRQAAFCISLPVSPQLSEPQWMQEQRGQAFADINAGFLAAVLQRDQLLQDNILRLQSQLQLVCSHSAQLQVLAEKVVRTAVRGTPGLKQDPTKQQQQPNLNSPNKGPPALGNAAGVAAAEAAAASFPANQLPASPGNAFIGTQGLALLGSQVSPAAAAAAAAGVTAGPLLPFNPMQLTQRAGSNGVLRANSNGGAIMHVGPAAGSLSGGSSRGVGTAGGRAHIARQSQDEKALRQMWAEQQALLQDWQQRLHPLVNCQGSLETYLQLADRVGGGGVHAVHRVAAAQPWHLGQQQEEQDDQNEEQQEQEQKLFDQSAEPQGEDLGRTDSHRTVHVPGMSGLGATQPAGAAANAASAAAGGNAAAVADASSVQQVAGGAGPPATIALVAPAKQRQGGKRKAHDGQPLLKRRR